MPEPQLVQLDWPALVWYLPAAQLAHTSADAAEYMPAAQSEHELDEAPENMPALHGEQPLEPVAENWPAAQTPVHTDSMSSAVEPYRPEAHPVHVAEAASA